MKGIVRAAFALGLLCAARPLAAQHLLVPMDDSQQNHLKAYGLTFFALKAGDKTEWFLNYRGGSFLLPDDPPLRRKAALDGVTVVPISDDALNSTRKEIAAGNMDAITLEKAPHIAIYAPAKAPPWDDAVTLALKYAGIEYTQIWDDEILKTDISKFDWIHLHHEDFTGQENKLNLGFRDAPWFIEQRDNDLAAAQRNGFANIPALKKAVAGRLHDFVEKGGFLFAMCGATETLELAMAAQNVDIAGPFFDGTPMDPDADSKMDWTRAFAFQNAHLEMSPGVNAMSDIDGHQVNVLQFFGKVRSGRVDARTESPAGHSRFLRRDDVVQQIGAQTGRRGPRNRRRRAVGEISARRLRQRLVDVSRRA
jgi:hypothetical protein